MKNIEILAPAGNIETLKTALRSGAGAVYVGGQRFSARNNAVNFSNEDLITAVRECNRYGAKLYLAVNTIISDEETEDFCEYIKFSAQAGTDAYIVQDFGCAELIRKCVPDAVLHASTQMSVHTATGAEMLKELGWKRIVPARELNRQTIEKITRTGIETEIFVHGALCMSVSGQCYMSAVMGSRSANRGCCGQACRLPFTATGNRNFFALSLKDLSLIPCIKNLPEVDSLKIEGRMKRPEYVASAVHELRKALDGQKPDMNFLKGIFSRSGFTDGYFSGKRENMFGIREKEDVVSAHELIPEVHKIYRYEPKIYNINFHVLIKKDIPVEITAECNDITVKVTGDTPEIAVNRPTDRKSLEKQLSKLGDTVFSMGNISADIEDGLIVPAGKLNALRREITGKLTELIISQNTPHKTVTDYRPVFSEKPAPSDNVKIRTFCTNIQQAKKAVNISDYIILDSALSISGTALSELSEYRDKIILSPPRFIADEDKIISVLKNIREKYSFKHLMCHTPDCIAIGKKLGFRLHGNFTLNIFNSFSAEYMKTLGLEDFIISPESKLQQINNIRTDLPVGVLAYGKIPLMLTRNCPIKNESGCKKCSGFIKDRTGREFSVRCSPDYVEILNSDCLYMLDRLESFRNISFAVIMLDTETPEQTENIISGEKPSGNITRGLYYRGI
ncbi:MAG: U32 family peptidase [Ruminococcus sp.]|nr:U32 family peptidase [Ruminococcus sp.]